MGPDVEGAVPIAIREAAAGRDVPGREVHDRNPVIITQQVGQDAASLLGVVNPLPFPRRVLIVHGARGIEQQGEVAVARINVQQRIVVGVADRPIQTDTQVHVGCADRLGRRHHHRPVLLPHFLEGARHEGHSIALRVGGEGCLRHAEYGRTATGDLETAQECGGTGRIAHLRGVGPGLRFQDFQHRGHAGEGDVVIGRVGEGVHRCGHAVVDACAGEGAREILADPPSAADARRRRGVGSHEVDPQVRPCRAIHSDGDVVAARLGPNLIVPAGPVIGRRLAAPALGAAGDGDVLRQGDLAVGVTVIVGVDQFGLRGRVGPVLSPVGGEEVQEQQFLGQRSPRHAGDDVVKHVEGILNVALPIMLTDGVHVMVGIGRGPLRADLFDVVFVVDIEVALVEEAGGGNVGTNRATVARRVKGRIHGIHRQVGVALNILSIATCRPAVVVGLEEGVAAAVIGILEIVLELVIDRPLTATGPHHGRVNPDPTLPRFCPVSDAAPTDPVLHADVDVVATALDVGMAAKNLVIPLPGLSSPGGDLLSLSVGVDPVFQGVGRTLDRACGGDGILGVPHGDAHIVTADGEILDEAFVQGDAIYGRATRTRRTGRRRGSQIRQGT